MPFLCYMGGDDKLHLLMKYEASDDDLPRNLWPGQDEPLVEEWEKKGAEEFRRKIAQFIKELEEKNEDA